MLSRPNGRRRRATLAKTHRCTRARRKAEPRPTRGPAERCATETAHRHTLLKAASTKWRGGQRLALVTPTGGVPFPQQATECRAAAGEACLLPSRHEDAKVDVVDLQRSRSRARLARVERGTCGKCLAQLKEQRQD